MRAACETCSPPCPADTGRFIYISTTGVYGPAGGDWVDEETPPDPRREGGRASLAAEQALAAHPLGKRGVILRLAGIYGPGRIPFLRRTSGGRADSGAQRRAPQPDSRRRCGCGGRRGRPSCRPFADGPRVYCVSDGHPVQRGEYYAEVARLIGAPPPQFTAPDPDSPRAARAEADRRMRNDRMLAELGVQLAYPNYRAGLAKILG